MHLWGNDKDAYWGNYDFANAIRVGMEKNGIPYSGEYDFVDTYSFWPITHMVAPKEGALSCAACHSQTSRLQNIDGIYLPGRDNSEWLDKIGLLAIMATLLAVLGHALMRIVARKRGDLS